MAEEIKVTLTANVPLSQFQAIEALSSNRSEAARWIIHLGLDARALAQLYIVGSITAREAADRLVVLAGEIP